MTRRNDSGYSYIGRMPCGCVVAAVVDCGDGFTGKAVSDFIRDGLTVERVTHDYVRANFTTHCPHKKQESEQMGLPLDIPQEA